MAAEWDNLIPDSRDMPSKNGSLHEDFEDSSDRKLESKKTSKARKKKTYSSTSEQSLLSEDQDDYSVTEYVMEYTDIFEPSTQQKLDFVDIQEGDKISEASDDEIVAHSSEAKTYEHTDVVDSEDSEDSSRLPPVDTGMDTFGIDVDLGMNNGIADESEEYDEALVMDNEGRNTLSNNIETNLGNLVKVEENGKRENKQVDAQVKSENKQVEVPRVKSENKQVEASKVKHENKQVEKVKSENKQVEKMKSENSQMEAQKVDEMIEQGSEGEEKEGSRKEDEKQSDDEQSEEQVEILAEDDYSDDTTEVDKLLQDNNTKVENKIDRRKTKSKMVSSGTQAHEAEPLLNISQTPSPPETPSPSQTPSPEPQDSSRHRKQFTPREYPGKAVKSIAIGTDDDYPSNEYTKERHARASPAETQKRGKGSTGKVRPRQNIENGVKTPTNASTPSSTRTPTSTRTQASSRSHRQANGDTPTPRSSKQLRGGRGSQSTDAMFFKSRLSQTSKRHPKRHVWLVRDSEIHRLIAEKAAILRRYKEEGITGRIKSKGFPNYSEVDVLGLPSVGFSGRTKDDSHRSSIPYGRHPSSRSSHGGYHGGSSSEDDDDERTNRLGTKQGKSGTFAVGLAARREQAESTKQHEPGDQEEGCELCAAEAREKEKHEQKLKELEAAAKAGPHHPRNLMLGIVYSAKFLGSTNLMSPSAPNKAVRLQQAQEAIGRIKVPEGEEQPSSDVDLFISTERIKIVSSENKQPLTDHHLKTISFIADIGNIIVVMARLSTESESKTWSGKMPDFSPQKEKQEEKTTKVICHVLETAEAQTVAKTVGQAFNIAYHEFLKANRLNLGEVEDLEYNGILEQQKILGEELSLLADETKTKEVVIHKKYGESLSLMIVESGWGSMIPTVVIAHMDNKGPAAKSGQLNVGNQILAVNGQSLVGLPLLECQNIIKAQKYEERVAFKVVSCPPTVEISINRPDTKYQLGFSVQNGMICSLMRGGIAERGGVRVGHKIIEMNGESVVAASHHHIVDILQTTIGELRMKTMPITLYKLLVGLEVPQYL